MVILGDRRGRGARRRWNVVMVVFRDGDGVEWSVSWRPEEWMREAARGGDRLVPAMLEFRCSAVVFWAPKRSWAHPRSIPRAELQEMVDRALEGDLREGRSRERRADSPPLRRH